MVLQKGNMTTFSHIIVRLRVQLTFLQNQLKKDTCKILLDI